MWVIKVTVQLLTVSKNAISGDPRQRTEGPARLSIIGQRDHGKTSSDDGHREQPKCSPCHVSTGNDTQLSPGRLQVPHFRGAVLYARRPVQLPRSPGTGLACIGCLPRSSVRTAPYLFSCCDSRLVSPPGLSYGGGTAPTHPPRPEHVPGLGGGASVLTGVLRAVRRVRGYYTGVNGLRDRA